MSIKIYIKIFVVRPSVRNGRSPEVAWPQAESCSLLGTLAVGGHREDAFVQTSQGISDGQDHQRIQRAELERDTSEHLLLLGPDRKEIGFTVND